MLYIVMALVLIFSIWLVVRSTKNRQPPPRQTGTIRCPHCGAAAPVYGSRWECGYCGDSGELYS